MQKIQVRQKGTQMSSKQHWLKPVESGKCKSREHLGHWSYCEQSKRVFQSFPKGDPRGKRYSEEDEGLVLWVSLTR